MCSSDLGPHEAISVVELFRSVSPAARRIEEESVTRVGDIDGLDVHDRRVGAGADLFGQEVDGAVKLVVIAGLKIEARSSVAWGHREGYGRPLRSHRRVRPRRQAAGEELSQFGGGGHASVARWHPLRLLVGLGAHDEAVGVVGDEDIVVEGHDSIAGEGKLRNVVLSVPEGATRSDVRDLPACRVDELRQVLLRRDG